MVGLGGETGPSRAPRRRPQKVAPISSWFFSPSTKSFQEKRQPTQQPQAQSEDKDMEVSPEILSNAQNDSGPLPSASPTMKRKPDVSSLSADIGAMTMTHGKTLFESPEAYRTPLGSNRLQSLVKSLGGGKSLDFSPLASPRSITPRPNSAKQSPQGHLNSRLEQLGYATTTFRALNSAYYNTPTGLQMASYGRAVIESVRAGDERALRRYLDHLSGNPCTPKGESILHMICRQGSISLLRVMVEQQQQALSGEMIMFQAVDQYGRTALHEACWAKQPSFELVECLLDHNPALLFLEDSRGASALSYIHSEKWPLWINFLQSKIHKWFPATPTASYQRGMDIARQGPDSVPCDESICDLSLEEVALIASGQIVWRDPDFTPVKLIGANRADDLFDSEISDIDDSSSASTEVGFGHW